MAAHAELHVLPHEHDGTWVVGFDPSSPALSRHATADQAQLEARRVAAARGHRRLYLHDRYRRVRTIPLAPLHR